ncbi:hypothetical protein VPH35_005917 [Triticum aestivum]
MCVRTLSPEKKAQPSLILSSLLPLPPVTRASPAAAAAAAARRFRRVLAALAGAQDTHVLPSPRSFLPSGQIRSSRPCPLPAARVPAAASPPAPAR